MTVEHNNLNVSHVVMSQIEPEEKLMVHVTADGEGLALFQVP